MREHGVSSSTDASLPLLHTESCNPRCFLNVGPQKTVVYLILYAELTAFGCSDERGKLH